jgi:hypothetical protein
MSHSLASNWPAVAPATLRPDHPDSPLLIFNVSLNEEHVMISIHHGLTAVYLGERSHHCSLLALARLRLHDAGRGVDPSSQGWTDTDRLAQGLGIDEAHLNIHIFRARKLFGAALAGMPSLPNIIERRRCECRLGGFRFQIVRGSVLEGSFPPNTN